MQQQCLLSSWRLPSRPALQPLAEPLLRLRTVCLLPLLRSLLHCRDSGTAAVPSHLHCVCRGVT